MILYLPVYTIVHKGPLRFWGKNTCY